MRKRGSKEASMRGCEEAGKGGRGKRRGEEARKRVSE